jgi:hypothetical protein
MPEQTNQAIIRHSQTTTLHFAGVPSKATRDTLAKYGFTYDPKSGNWFKSEKASSVITEENVATNIAA